MAAPTIGFSGIAMRFLFAFALVCFTWNPTRYNYVAWALAQWQQLGAARRVQRARAARGLVLLPAHDGPLARRGRARALLALAGAVLWALFKYNLVSSESTTLMSWIVLVLFSAILAAGMSWAHLRNRWSGQATVDEVDTQ